ncbi:hypothetical protein HZA73_07175 [candidate division TA06 bacterium]|nr:hypothetical protein [candidate division TA06 bacterium]
MNTCALCLNPALLSNSHLIPSFVFRWIKDTSATGYLRLLENPNIRRQDGLKDYLLCQQCESIFNKYETPFASNIFYPYVNNALSPEGIGVGKPVSFKYDNWLLYFAISLQWRHLVTSKLRKEDYDNVEFYKTIEEYIDIWRDFLIGNRFDTGDCETHIIFLQNLIAGKGYLPPNINERINSYLIRAVDATIVTSKKKLGIYTKIGPIVFFTSLIPNKLKLLPNSKIHMKGNISTAQNLYNKDVTSFIFVDRPNDISSKIQYSQKQQDKIEEEFMKNPDKTANSMTFKVLETDLLLRKHLSDKNNK